LIAIIVEQVAMWRKNSSVRAETFSNRAFNLFLLFQMIKLMGSVHMMYSTTYNHFGENREANEMNE